MNNKKVKTAEEYKCGYLGPEGTFSEMAALKYGKLCDKIIPYKTIREVVENVRKGEIDRGIIPLENSLEGSVKISLDLLFDKSGLSIIDEVVIPIEHYLLAPPGVTMTDITDIYSHPQVLGQAGDFVYEHFPRAELHYTESSASAVDRVLDNGHKAMIGSRRISDLYPLEILAENVEGDLSNHTRFVVVAFKEKAEVMSDNHPDRAYKTSIICAPDVNRPGVLYQILGEFASRNIDLTRIESRPTKEKLGEYLFYIDLAGHLSQEKLSTALGEVEKICGLFKVLGSYPRANMNNEGRDDKDELTIQKRAE